MLSSSDACIKTAEEAAEQKAQQKKEKRLRQNRMKVAVLLSKCASMGSSNSDGFIPIELKDVKFLADKASDDKI
eukprot:1048320-Amphidinium_carterae.1